MNRKERRAEETKYSQDARKISKIINNPIKGEDNYLPKKVIKQETLENGHAIIYYKWEDHIGLNFPHSIMVLKDGKLRSVAPYMDGQSAELAYNATIANLKDNG